MPGTHAAPAGAWNVKLNWKVPLGPTLPLTCAARLGADQSAPANLLARSRGIVVPSFVFASQVLAPTLRNTMLAASFSPHLSVIAVDANGHDWLTNFAPHGGVCPH